MNKRTYRSKEVKNIDWNKLKESLSGEEIAEAIDVAKQTQFAVLTVTIGMPVTRHPSCRSQRALLTHWAPVSGSGVKTLKRPGMQNTYRGNKGIPQSSKPCPSHSAALAASPQCAYP